MNETNDILNKIENILIEILFKIETKLETADLDVFNLIKFTKQITEIYKEFKMADQTLLTDEQLNEILTAIQNSKLTQELQQQVTTLTQQLATVTTDDQNVKQQLSAAQATVTQIQTQLDAALTQEQKLKDALGAVAVSTSTTTVTPPTPPTSFNNTTISG